MAVVAVKSTQITNRDAVPRVPIDGRVQGGSVKGARGTAAVANGDSIGSTYRLCSVPSNALVKSAALSCTAITTCAGDIGLYRTTQDGGAVVDADFFKAAQSLAAALARSEVGQGNVMSVANLEKPIWQLLGLSADPQLMYDVVITLTAAAASAGNVAMDVDWVQ